MMHTANFHRFTPAGVAGPEQTYFHRDGSRTVCGPLGSVHYDADGNARFVPDVPTDSAATVRFDLAA